MSSIGSLGLDSIIVFCVISCMGQRGVFAGYWCPPRAIISTAPGCTKELLCQKYALLKKNKQPTRSLSLIVSQLRAHYRCTTTTTTAVWPGHTANNTAIRARTLLLLLYHHCCCMYTYRRECTTPTKLSLPCATALPRVGHGLTMSQGRILQQSRGW